MAQTAIEQLEQGKQRLDRLMARRTRLQVQLEAARQQYNDAVQEAEATYQTSELPKLRELLASKEAENTRVLAEFIGALNDFEGYISKIETALVNPEALAALVAAMPAVTKPVSGATVTTPELVFDEEDI